MAWWLAQAGMPWFAVPLFLVLAFVFFLGLTRAVVEVGFAEAVAPKIAPDITISWLGTELMGPRGMTLRRALRTSGAATSVPSSWPRPPTA